MQTHLRGRDMITTQEWTKDEIDTILDVALDLKRKRALGISQASLRHKVLAMLFFFTSTRTRSSFEAGMAQLGGHAAFIDSTTTQISHGDTAKEIGEIYGRYYDGIAIRQCDWGIGNRYIRDVAAASRVPILNMQCDHFHPFQILADLLTIVEKKGDPRGLTINVSYAYAQSYQKPMSVPISLILLMTRYGMNVRLTHPPEFKLMPQYVEQAKENARKSGGSLELLDDFDAGFVNADVVYPKSWGCMLTTESHEESAAISRQYTHWITDERRMALAKPDALYMHCLPADRNIEVTDGVIDGPNSVVYDEAENRLHVQKAVMALTM
ncbi:MAG: ornithine carbamoyltransferase [Ardenticatenales bacterium]|nr:ornithine carbamoyltransferase [Ardenticatenales bacterium]